MTRNFSDYEDQLRTELLAGRSDPWDISSPQDELKKFRFFASGIEDLITNAEQSEVEFLRQSVEHLSEEAQGEFWLNHYPIHWNEIFRETIRGSVIVSLATFLETFLDRLCYRVALVMKSELRANDLRGSTLERAQRFLIAVGHFDNPAAPMWDEIGLFFKIRNVIVHSAGFIASAPYQKQIENFCRKRPDIQIVNKAIEIKPKFVEHIIDQLSEFVEHLEEEFRLLCERTRGRK